MRRAAATSQAPYEREEYMDGRNDTVKGGMPDIPPRARMPE